MSKTLVLLISCFVIQKYVKAKILILCPQSIRKNLLKEFNKLQSDYEFKRAGKKLPMNAFLVKD